MKSAAHPAVSTTSTLPRAGNPCRGVSEAKRGASFPPLPLGVKAYMDASRGSPSTDTDRQAEQGARGTGSTAPRRNSPSTRHVHSEARRTRPVLRSACCLAAVMRQDSNESSSLPVSIRQYSFASSSVTGSKSASVVHRKNVVPNICMGVPLDCPARFHAGQRHR